MFCPRCGAEHRPSQRFCAKCGAALGVAEDPQSVSAAFAAQSVPAMPAATAVTQPPAATPEGSLAGTQPTTTVPQPSPTLTGAIPEGGFTIEDIVAWLQSDGYTTKVVPDGDGESHVVTNTQNSPCNIFPNDFKGGRYASLGLGTGFAAHGKFDISHINEWNSNNRWCRAYYDSVNDPWLVMDIDLWPGGTYESLRDQFGAWNNTLGRFIEKYGLK
jgi:Putative bacterial sensory transduction regulator/zinc-ribbon domain